MAHSGGYEFQKRHGRLQAPEKLQEEKRDHNGKLAKGRRGGRIRVQVSVRVRGRLSVRFTPWHSQGVDRLLADGRRTRKARMSRNTESGKTVAGRADSA